MNRMTRITALALAMAPALAFGQAATWNIDSLAHPRRLQREAPRHLRREGRVRRRLSGKAQIDEADLSKSSVEVTIEAASVDTRDEKRDNHLKSADFFDVAKFPTITFKSTKVVAGKDGALTVTGDLTMRGVTKPVTLEGSITKAITDPWGNTRRGVSFTGKLEPQGLGRLLEQGDRRRRSRRRRGEARHPGRAREGPPEEVARTDVGVRAAPPAARRGPQSIEHAAAGTEVAPARRRMHSGPWKVDGPARADARLGPAALSDAELVALVLGTGSGRLSARAAALALVEASPVPELAWALPRCSPSTPASGRRAPRRWRPPSSWGGGGPGPRRGGGSASSSPRAWPS